MGKMTVDLATQLMDGETLDYDNDAEREIFVPVNLITLRQRRHLAQSVGSSSTHCPLSQPAARGW